MRNLLSALLITSAMLPAQQNIVYHDDPSPTAGGGNAFPFGVQGVRIQQLVPQSALGGPAVIQDLFVNAQIWATGSVNVTQVYYGDFEIRMGITQLTTLTNTWATNLPNPTTVYRGPLLVRFERDHWTALGLPNSFLWLPTSPSDNLVVDFICWQVLDTGAQPPDVNGYFMNSRRSPTSSISRAYRLGWTASQPPTSLGVDGSGIKLGFLLNDGNFVAHDGSCAGSSGLVPTIGATPGTWPQKGAQFDLQLSNGPANLIAVVMLGLDTVSYGGIPLPLDLTSIGAPGCTIWHGPEVLMSPVLTDAAGASSFALQVPGPAGLSGRRLFATWLCIDPAANPLWIVPSGYATLTL